MMIIVHLNLFVFLVQLLAVPHQFFNKLIHLGDKVARGSHYMMFNLCQGGIVDGGQLIGGGLERRQHRLETARRRVRSQLLADLQVHLEFSLNVCSD